MRPSSRVTHGGVRIIVDDQGEGIPAELRRRVFTKFWQHGARGGSGLGLYIVGGLTKAHGGTVTIDDAPGGGARVVLAWPRRGPAPGSRPDRPCRRRPNPVAAGAPPFLDLPGP